MDNLQMFALFMLRIKCSEKCRTDVKTTDDAYIYIYTHEDRETEKARTPGEIKGKKCYLR